MVAPAPTTLTYQDIAAKKVHSTVMEAAYDAMCEAAQDARKKSFDR